MRVDLADRFELYLEDEFPLVQACVELAGRDVLDIGCGSGETTRQAVVEGGARRAVGLEVDEIQFAKNGQREWPAGVGFRLLGAEALDFPDASFDTVLMFKSLHHVPGALMAQAFAEIRRVLRPGGRVYVSEPVFAGPLNEITRLYHDEEVVRERAIDAIEAALHDRLFTRERQVRFQAPVHYASWEAFRKKIAGTTHTTHVLAPELEARVEAAFRAHLAPGGAHFVRPMRVDVLLRA
ncbi:MAG TPA: class I SAM-dependent methyltransferase [Ramlibacter sp.]|nr:class I SAM-dependent methyltransferase [Ramlibacter sp.]